jgi:hypothetical protein
MRLPLTLCFLGELNHFQLVRTVMIRSLKRALQRALGDGRAGACDNGANLGPLFGQYPFFPVAWRFSLLFVFLHVIVIVVVFGYLVFC